MKIGILTYNFVENKNYGAMLQMYALYTYLKDLGYEPYIINYEWRSKSFSLSLFLSSLNNYVFSSFSRKYLPNKTSRVNKFNAKILNKELDTFIVGSDQVWRYKYVPDIRNFFLDFVDDTHLKISYAASFGRDKFDESSDEIIKDVSTLLEKFDAVSVREFSGVAICKQLGKNATHVLDPTLLLESSYYEKFVTKRKGSYLGYFLLDNDPVMVKLIKEKSISIGVGTLCLSHTYKIGRRRILHSINKWLSLIYNSNLIVTDSYHCVLFSIIMRKNFYVLLNEKRGVERIHNILSVCHLSDRIIKNVNEIVIYDKINYDEVEKELQLMKMQSKEFLYSALNINKYV